MFSPIIILSTNKVLCLGGILTERGKAELLKMDDDFYRKYISLGGCADLLAVTHFAYCLEHTVIMEYNIVTEKALSYNGGGGI